MFGRRENSKKDRNKAKFLRVMENSYNETRLTARIYIYIEREARQAAFIERETDLTLLSISLATAYAPAKTMLLDPQNFDF